MKKIKILISLSDGPFFRAEKNSAAEKFRLVLLGFIGYYIGIKKNDSRFYAIKKISWANLRQEPMKIFDIRKKFIVESPKCTSKWYMFIIYISFSFVFGTSSYARVYSVLTYSSIHHTTHITFLYKNTWSE